MQILSWSFWGPSAKILKEQIKCSISWKWPPRCSSCWIQMGHLRTTGTELSVQWAAGVSVNDGHVSDSHHEPLDTWSTSWSVGGWTFWSQISLKLVSDWSLWLFCMSWIKQLCFLLCVKKYILLFRIKDTFIFLSSLDLIFEIFFLKFKQMFWNRNLLLNKDVDFSECVLLWKNCFVSNQMILEVRQQQLQHYSNPEMRKLMEEHNVIIYLMQL